MSEAGGPKGLTELRPELQLLNGAPSPNGEPTWLVHDPVANQFFQIDCAAYEALRHWRDCSSADELIVRANASQRVSLDERSLGQLVEFLHANQLTTEPRSEGWRQFARQRASSRHSLSGKLVHNYLFFRVPLWRPQVFLERTLPLARALATPGTHAAVALLGIAGIYLVSRQWEEFTGTFQSMFSWEGAVLTAVALMLVKAAHELGHAYTAVRFGCRVHTMGVAFVVLAPMLYTDVTDAWRLRDRRQRILIDSAGIRVELAIAAVALFLWAFLPEGALRSSAFLLSAVSIASSLAINLNPFMRFDGYYLLSEAIGIENLQSRSFAVGRWKMRELLFGLGAPCPEDLPRRLVVALVVYAWGVWVYRLLLFVGIALLVYHYFFKLLGIILFAVEIIYFVAQPVAAELKVWFMLRRRIAATRRTLLTAASAFSALVLCLIPWSTRVDIPVVVESARLQMIFPVRAAWIEARHVEHGAVVRTGNPIISLSSPEVNQQLEQARTALSLAKLQHARRLADAADREGSLILESAIAALAAKIEGLEKERAELKIVAPFDGRVVDLNPDLHPGRWISPRDQIAVVAVDAPIVARGYVAESDLWRVAEGAVGVLIPEQPQRRSLRVRIDQIATAGTSQVEIADLASTNSGRIAVNPDEKRRLVPATAQYMVNMSVLETSYMNDVSFRGVVLADGRAENSIGSRVASDAQGAVARERLLICAMCVSTYSHACLITARRSEAQVRRGPQ